MIKIRKRPFGGYKTREKQREQHLKWRRANPEKVKQHNQAYYIKHKERIKRVEAIRNYMRLGKRRQQREQLKVRVLTHYGNGKLACVVCGESRLVCLSIDHLNNKGAEHRKKIGNDIYIWLEENNYPSGFQTLCMNDQWIKKAEYSKTNREKKSKYLGGG